VPQPTAVQLRLPFEFARARPTGLLARISACRSVFAKFPKDAVVMPEQGS